MYWYIRILKCSSLYFRLHCEVRVVFPNNYICYFDGYKAANASQFIILFITIGKAKNVYRSEKKILAYVSRLIFQTNVVLLPHDLNGISIDRLRGRLTDKNTECLPCCTIERRLNIASQCGLYVNQRFFKFRSNVYHEFIYVSIYVPILSISVFM